MTRTPCPGSLALYVGVAGRERLVGRRDAARGAPEDRHVGEVRPGRIPSCQAGTKTRPGVVRDRKGQACRLAGSRLSSWTGTLICRGRGLKSLPIDGDQLGVVPGGSIDRHIRQSHGVSG